MSMSMSNVMTLISVGGTDGQSPAESNINRVNSTCSTI